MFRHKNNDFKNINTKLYVFFEMEDWKSRI